MIRRLSSCVVANSDCSLCRVRSQAESNMRIRWQRYPEPKVSLGGLTFRRSSRDGTRGMPRKRREKRTDGTWTHWMAAPTSVLSLLLSRTMTSRFSARSATAAAIPAMPAPTMTTLNEEAVPVMVINETRGESSGLCESSVRKVRLKELVPPAPRRDYSLFSRSPPSPSSAPLCASARPAETGHVIKIDWSSGPCSGLRRSLSLYLRRTFNAQIHEWPNHTVQLLYTTDVCSCLQRVRWSEDGRAPGCLAGSKGRRLAWNHLCRTEHSCTCTCTTAILRDCRNFVQQS